MANYNKATAARNEEEYYQWFNVNYDELFNNISISDYNAELINVQLIAGFDLCHASEIKPCV